MEKQNKLRLSFLKDKGKTDMSPSPTSHSPHDSSDWCASPIQSNNHPKDPPKILCPYFLWHNHCILCCSVCCQGWMILVGSYPSFQCWRAIIFNGKIAEIPLLSGPEYSLANALAFLLQSLHPPKNCFILTTIFTCSKKYKSLHHYDPFFIALP